MLYPYGTRTYRGGHHLAHSVPIGAGTIWQLLPKISSKYGRAVGKRFLDNPAEKLSAIAA
jgi:hypothetical protein